MRSNAGPEEKHRLRQYFHKQLKELWNQKPLVTIKQKFLDPSAKDTSLNIIMNMNGFNFAPLVAEKLSNIAELTITILRPEPPGTLVLQSGDIDNRIKTLLDSLSKPPHDNSLPRETSPLIDEDPFFCLLEDDSLISKLSISTDRLLLPGVSSNESVIQIKVVTKHIEVYWGTVGLSG